MNLTGVPKEKCTCAENTETPAAKYPIETLPSVEEEGYANTDDGTMPANVEKLRQAVVGEKIVSVTPIPASKRDYQEHGSVVLELSGGKRVMLKGTDDCCAYTAVKDITLNLPMIDHIITGVGTTDKFHTWHIYADLGDIMKLSVEWSCGNPFYYAYGFKIEVMDEWD